jgi:hypothetical protein
MEGILMKVRLIAHRTGVPLWVVEGVGCALGGMALMAGATAWLLTGHPPTEAVEMLVSIGAVGMGGGQCLLVLGGFVNWVARRGLDW